MSTYTRLIKKLGRRVRSDQSDQLSVITRELQDGARWVRLPVDSPWVTFDIGPDVKRIEVLGGLRPTENYSERSVICRLRFIDQNGSVSTATVPHVRVSAAAGHYFYPFQFREAEAFRFSTSPPAGTKRVEVALQKWRKADPTVYEGKGIHVRPVENDGRQIVSVSVDADLAALQNAIATYAWRLLADPAALTAEAQPFGEAVVEHYIYETGSIELAARLAERRLAAGRDREALALLGLVEDPSLVRASQRRSLERWVARWGPTQTAPKALSVDTIFVVAQASSSSISQLETLRRLASDGQSIEVFAPMAESGGASPMPAWTVNLTEPFDPFDVAGVVARLSDQVVRAGRPRAVGLIWAFGLTDALASIDAGCRLGAPVVYEMEDVSEFQALYEVAGWVGTDAGQRDQGLYLSALTRSTWVVVGSKASADWLGGVGIDPEKILVAPSSGDAANTPDSGFALFVNGADRDDVAPGPAAALERLLEPVRS